ncbi:MAG TPA: bifunctional DNA-formamidopyrimidine glycosylase/DNA-(apurinic or apyrimidinic site) lyase [Solirubrobacteraceae bacterium]|nr:bifunctional DNA-formamidopyrimidine glycosylase/DNA-(apurinic or apyrimidinic site) lyase [Solirubrobacteraceae bacterium]
MPELPEVETIRRQLAPHLEGRVLAQVDILDHRWTLPAPPELVAAELTGARVQRLARRGKYLIWEFDDGRSLLVHLRMTGSLLLNAEPPPPYVRARLELDDGAVVSYVDPRRFGTAHLMRSPSARDAYLAARLGAEPFTPAFTADYLQAQARGRTAPVKAFLLDQRRMAGVGNIYADEALYRARVHPLRPAGSLTASQWRDLKGAIEDALAAGIDAKGASIDDFRHVDGARGSFQDRFLVHLRAGAPCAACGTAIRKIVVGGRGTYVCERCQPRPRIRGRRPAA